MADLELGVGIALDVGAIRRAVEQMGQIIERLGRDNRALTSSFERIERSGERAFRNVGDAAAGAVRNFNRLSDPVEELRDDLASVEARAAATRETLERVGANPQLFAVAQRELDKMLRLQAEFNDRQEQVARDPALLRVYENRFSAIRTVVAKEISNINETLRSTARERGQINARENAILKDQIQERADIRRRARGVEVAQIQTESAQLVQARRAQANAAIQQSQRQARVRIELLRFTFRQAQTLERAIGRVFAGTATVIQGAYARIENTVFRIGRVFRRSNRQLDDGLAPALRAREGALARSFSRQNTIVTSSLTRQERTVQAFNARLSSGVAGAATGRSGLGALLGGGLAFGGGFVLLNKLKAGFDEAVDLNEALNKTREIFGDAAGDIEAFTQNSVEALFITQSVALEGAANFGIFGKAAGLAGEDLSDFSIELLTLATDLASFNNTTVDDAIVSLSAALRGESEPIRRYGVLLNQAVLQQRALSEGIIQEIRVLTPAERVLAAYAEILAQTTDAQGDAARTADDFANSSRRAAAASVETFAAIAENLIPIAEIITNAALPSFQGLTAFIRDEVGPILSAVRDGLIGASAALAGLLAARVAGEAVSFLAIALRAASSPLGLFVTAVAGIGAAVNILRLRIPEVQVALERFGQIARDVLGAGLDLALEGFDLLANFIIEVGLPALRDLASFVGNQLRRALEVSFNFIATTVVPILERFVALVTGTIIPAVEELADIIVNGAVRGFELLRSAAETVLTVVEPLVRPAIEGFRELGEVIAGAFRGDADFQDLLAGLGGAVAGIGSTFANIGVAIYEALRPQVERAINFISDAFQNIDFESIAGAILDVVELIGRILGTIVSSREFVTAVGAIAVAAVAVGVRFAKGFIEGVVSNLDDLGELAVDAIRLGFNEALGDAFNPETIATIIIGAFAAAALYPAITQLLRRPAEQAGIDTAQNFAQSFATRAKGVFARNDFAAGLFGGTSGLQAQFDREARKAEDALVRAQVRASDRLRALGVTPNVSFTGDAIEFDAVKQVEELEDRFGRAAVAGAEMRGRIVNAFTEIGSAGNGLARSLQGDLSGGFFQIRRAAGNFAREVGGIIRQTARQMREIGAGVGQALGGAIVSGIGAALSGQQLGAADSGFGKGLGLAGIISSALFGAAAVGGGPQGAFVGGTILALGGLSAAFAASGKAAEEAAARVQTYVDILREVTNLADAIPGVAEQITNVLLDQDDALTQALADAGVRSTDIADRIVDGAFSIRDAFEVVAEGFDFDTSALERLGDQLGDTENIDDLNRLIGSDLQNALDGTGVSVQEFLGLIRALNDEAGAFEEAQEEVDLRQTFDPQIPESFSRSVEDIRGRVRAVGDDIRDSFDIFGGLSPVEENPFQDLLDTFLPDLSFEVDAVAEAIESLNNIRTTELNSQIDAAASELGTAREAARLAREALTEYFTSDYTNAAQSAVDNLINSVGSAGSAVGEALELGGVRGESALNTAAAGFASSIAQAIQEGFDAGLDVAGITATLAPVRDAINEAVAAEDISQGAADELNRVLDDALDDQSLQAGIDFVLEAEAEVAAIQAELDRLNAELEVNLKFNPAEVLAQIAALGLEVDLTPEEFNRRVSELQALPSPNIIDPAEAAFLAGAQRDAREQATSPTTNNEQTINESTNVTIEAPITILGTTPVQTASEVVSELVTAGASAIGSYSAPSRRRSPVRVASSNLRAV